MFFIVGGSRDDQLRRQQRIKRAFTQTVRGNFQHHQSGAEIFYIHIYQVVEFRVIPNSPLSSLRLAQSDMYLNTGSLNPGGFQVRIGGRERGRVARSTAEDPGEDLHRGEPRQHQLVDGRGSRRGPLSRGSATGSTHRRKRIKEKTFIERINDMINSSTEEDQGEDLQPEN